MEGHELPPDLPVDQRQEYLRIALQSKDVLLVLDDVWRTVELQQLIVIDRHNTRSKVLVSTRIRGLVADDTDVAVVEAQLPSIDDAVLLLLGSAEMMPAASDTEASAAVVAAAPAEARQIAEMMERLPLALGICGKILKDLSIKTSDSWQGVIDVIEEVMSGQKRSIEESVILASLQGLPADARQLFYCLGLAAEDSVLSLAAVVMLYEASLVNQGTNAVDGTRAAGRGMTIMRARRLMKLLIDFSLVTGTVDSVHVHDIILDNARSHYTTEQWRSAHCAVVEQLIAQRPTYGDVNGWEYADHPLSDYTKQAVLYHMRAAMDSGSAITRVNDSRGLDADSVDSASVVLDADEFAHWQAEHATAIGWLSQGCAGTIDTIAYAAGTAIGLARTIQLAEAAEAAGEFWLATVRWAVIRRILNDKQGRASSTYEVSAKQIELLQKVRIGGTSAVPGANNLAQLQLQCDRLELRALVFIIQSWSSDLLAKHLPRLMQLLGGTHGGTILAEDPPLAYLVGFIQLVPLWFGGDIDGFANGLAQLFYSSLDGVSSLDDSDSRKVLVTLAASCYCCFANHIVLIAQLPDFSWDAIKPVLDTCRSSYSYSLHHRPLVDLCSLDGAFAGAYVWPLVLRWANLTAAARQYAVTMREQWPRILHTNDAADAATTLMTCWTTTFQLFCIGQHSLAAGVLRQTIGVGLQEMEKAAQEMYGKMLVPMYNCRQLVITLKCIRVLVDETLTPAEVRQFCDIDSLDPAEFKALALDLDAPSRLPCLNYHSIVSPCVLVALTFYKLGWIEQASAFATAALTEEQTGGGDSLVSTRLWALMIVGQIQARKGEAFEAAFDESASIAERVGLRLYEVLALYAWRQAVIAGDDPEQRVEERWARVCAELESSEEEFVEMSEKVWRPISAEPD